MQFISNGNATASSDRTMPSVPFRVFCGACNSPMSPSQRTKPQQIVVLFEQDTIYCVYNRNQRKKKRRETFKNVKKISKNTKKGVKIDQLFAKMGFFNGSPVLAFVNNE